MDIFFWGVIILFALTLIFYLVMFGLMYYWHEAKTTFVVVPFMFAFEFFLAAFLVFAIVMLIVNYYPVIISAL